MRELYTIKGYKGNNERYIQQGDACRPIIQTRTGYRASRVIVFKDKEQAYEFLVNFINDRKRNDIVWNIQEYRPARNRQILAGMVKKYGRFDDLVPGEVWVDYNGEIHTHFYDQSYAKLNDVNCMYYTV